MTYMISETKNRVKPELTIVSRSLLRAPPGDWHSPSLLVSRIGGKALLELIAEMNDPCAQAALYYRRRSLLMFDCMLRVIDEPEITSVLQLGMKRFGELQDIFYGALASSKFNALAPSSRLGYARAFYTLLSDLRKKFKVASSSFIPNSNKYLPDELAILFERIELDKNEVENLQPFLLHDKNGEAYNVLLTPMISVLGRSFTSRFHAALCDVAASKAKDAALRDFGTTFARFINDQSKAGRPITEQKLQDAGFVRETLVDLMEHHFMRMVSMKGGPQEGTLASLQKLWSRNVIYLNVLVKKGLIAKPQLGIPQGKTSLAYVKDVRHQRKTIRSGDDSSLVTHKLLTPIPLHLSDEATTHLIFEKINRDFNKVQDWLDSHIEQLWQHYQHGLRLAGPEPYIVDGEKNLVNLLNPKANPDALIEATRYFKHRHNGYVDTKQVVTAAYPDKTSRNRVSKARLAQLLGIPNREDAMALMAYLASVDGRFTESALADARLFDRNGVRINAVNSGDNTLTLSVLKNRAGEAGWHDIVLSGRAYVVVQRWIQLTTPLRDYMRKHQMKGWRNLIIYTGSPLGKPAFFNRTSNINSTFRAFAQRNITALGELADIVTIARLRAQRGILVFLQDFDVKAMARELGNDEDTSMRHYLPDAIWNYFAVRWIRIFQNLLIVEATRGTPYMARALRVTSAAELDEFLKNHALEPLIPGSARDADPSSEQEYEAEQDAGLPSTLRVQEIMVVASRGIFSTLLSVKEAVKSALDAGDEVNSKSLYWYEFTKRLQNHIESDAYPDRGIKKLLTTAALDVCPENYAKVIRA